MLNIPLIIDTFFLIDNSSYRLPLDTHSKHYGTISSARLMAYARFRPDRHQVPSSVRMLMHGLEAAQELTNTLRDLRRTVKLLQSGLVILFPDETSGLQLLYSTLDRDLMQVERTSQFLTSASYSDGRDTS